MAKLEKELDKKVQEEYKLFKGPSIVDIMPMMASEGYVPISISDLMKKRLEVLKEPEEVFQSWWKWRYTGDATVSKNQKKGKTIIFEGKIILDSQHIRNLNPKVFVKECDRISQYISKNGLILLSKSDLCDSLLISSSDYDSLEGLKIPSSISHGPNVNYSFFDSFHPATRDINVKNKILNNQIWLYLARDKHLLKEYTQVSYHLAKKAKVNRFMGYGIYDFNSEELNLLSLDGLDRCSFLELYNFLIPFSDSLIGALSGDGRTGYKIVPGDYEFWGKKVSDKDKFIL